MEARIREKVRKMMQDLEPRVREVVEKKGFKLWGIEYLENAVVISVDEFIRVSLYPIPYQYLPWVEEFMEHALDLAKGGMDVEYFARLRQLGEMLREKLEKIDKEKTGSE